MVLNPGDLRHVEKTCAVEGCHPKDAHKVKNSLMATNRGILGTLLYYWGGVGEPGYLADRRTTPRQRQDLAGPGLFPQTLRHLSSLETEERPAQRGGLLQREGRRLRRLPFYPAAGRTDQRISVLPATTRISPSPPPIRPKRRSIRWSRPPSRAPTASGAITDPGVSACRISVCMNRRATAPPTRRAG